HTTFSDGFYSPSEIVELALRSGLSAIAITDHDTLEGIGPARLAAAGTDLEVIARVEISSQYEGRELHLLGYFVSTENASLQQALDELRRRRAERYREMIERLREQGVHLVESDLPGLTPPGSPGAHSLGRRHLADLLVRQRKASTVREAFTRYLRDGS